MLMVLICCIVALIGVTGAAILVMTRRRMPPAAQTVPATFRPGVSAPDPAAPSHIARERAHAEAHGTEPHLTEALAAESHAPAPAPAEPEIRWSLQFDPRSAGLDDTGRLRLIGDLGVIAKEWCVPLLCQAYIEERRPANRQAALSSLAACRSRAAIPTYRRALATGDPDECAIATDALADLETPAIVPSRTIIER